MSVFEDTNLLLKANLLIMYIRRFACEGFISDNDKKAGKLLSVYG